MAKKPFFPIEINEQLIWLADFKGALPAYSLKYGISGPEMSALDDDTNYLSHWLGVHGGMQVLGQNLTAFKNELAYGTIEGAAPALPPVIAAPGAAPTAVLPGVFPRALAIANRIKAHSLYNVTDGEALRLEGAEYEPIDLPNLKPVLKLVVPGVGTVDVGWKKNRTDGVEIWVKRGSGNWVLLAFDTTTPKYVDTHEFPAVEETWEYKGIYHVGGARAGQWSDVVSVQVKA